LSTTAGDDNNVVVVGFSYCFLNCCHSVWLLVHQYSQWHAYAQPPDNVERILEPGGVAGKYDPVRTSRCASHLLACSGIADAPSTENYKQLAASEGTGGLQCPLERIRRVREVNDDMRPVGDNVKAARRW